MMKNGFFYLKKQSKVGFVLVALARSTWQNAWVE
jgi:hypothetical protein